MKTDAAHARILVALSAVDGAESALRSARRELAQLAAEAERQRDADLDAAMDAEDEKLAEAAERLHEMQDDGLSSALWAVEAMVDTLRTDARAPLRRAAHRLRPPAPGALECLAAVGGRR